MASDNSFQVRILTPDRTFFQGEAELVEFTAAAGEVGIYKNHVPTVLVVRPGVLKLHSGSDTKEAALHSGFAEILGDSITVLAESAEWPDEIDVDRAKRAEERARERLASHDSSVDMMRAELALRRSLTRIRVGH